MSLDYGVTRQPNLTLVSSHLPLAVYREVMAHLQQVAGVEAGLLPPQSSQFDYNQSQIGGLWIRYPQGDHFAGQSQVEQILEYYRCRYGAWQPWSTTIC
ncbi:hypothetical protein GS597_04885 [Synechococcales cyanobacterium C]|uniref:Uncharacterized protein n=1 Tax=Petrachloros mirabilis ULC683 TaxID=2781853 RepID=A0A8K2A7D7_9CYAN|nr:hypothetical protein [Petrachloros mirabilis]NCJ05855.1 hypothetical protein [Petrachloros mirabilis ULC683]